MYIRGINISYMFTNFSLAMPTEDEAFNEFKQARKNAGIICPKCSNVYHKYRVCDKKYECRKCKHRQSIRAYTVLEDTKMPFRYWVFAMRIMSGFKKPVSASALQRLIGHKRYEPIWYLLQKLRIAMGDALQDIRLDGAIEMDEAFVESVIPKHERKEAKETVIVDKPQKRGRGSTKQSIVLVAVESEKVGEGLKTKGKYKPDRKAGRLRMSVLDDGSSASINNAVEGIVESTAHVETDGWRGYNELKQVVDKHTAKPVNDPKKAAKMFPWVHTAISNLKRQLNGVHHSIGKDYLQNYLNEFCFKFNSRYLLPKQMLLLLVKVSVKTNLYAPN